MNIAELLLLAVGLSMDAFAVAMCKGLAMGKISMKNTLLVGLWFGLFQALMPLGGYFLGSSFHDMITAVDHWVAFILLAIIGAQMLREALSKKQDAPPDPSLAFGKMLMLAVATSIDALAAGISMSCEEGTNIWLAVPLIGCTTFVLSVIGVKIGDAFGERFKKKAELAGGVILILLGLKILLSDLGVLPF